VCKNLLQITKVTFAYYDKLLKQV